MEPIQEWWRTVPQVTKCLFAGSMGLTIAANFGFAPFMYMGYFPRLVFVNFEVRPRLRFCFASLQRSVRCELSEQIWRIITTFFFHGQLGFGFLMHMMFLYDSRCALCSVR
jgi:hypothetical protein